MQTVEYAAGRCADVFGEPSQPTVLLWHGQQADARASVRALAELIAGHGLGVVAPDWNSHAADGGRADLLASVHFTRDRVDDPDHLVLTGWSMGGLAAAALTIQANQVGMRFAHTVCLAGAFMVPDPIFNELPASLLRDAAQPTPFTLLSGADDPVIPLAVAHDFAGALRGADWPVAVRELPADHGSIAGAVYDPAARAYHAVTDARSLDVATVVAAHIAEAARADR
ncbi:alpha/beta fold hydrolase [Candidatus Mycobacterium wuenschmannii]|uniref:Alpha/beta fold hydrolase n=1 Tax=Candidatus Mycobacterium wuenschmannii TaxID=3027808 RepID=A0ABY8W214_9MYCO|nr:alpha/beta fold hydrolase [Candidatus Mycobacterium wuenschmannii]WIM89054.1 alpha/beta fold hydrolase [Candidatus Mycobacterium wuenschmannii]